MDFNIRTMHGIGDSLYQRAIIRMMSTHPLRTIYVQTPWPQLFEGINVRCVMPREITTVSALRNSVRAYQWSEPAPYHVRNLRLTYVHEEGSIVQALARGAGFELQRPVNFAGPEVTPEFTRRGKPYIVVRPVTLRAEWHAHSRNPRAQYIYLAIEKLRRHFHIVSIADVYQGVEELVHPVPYADETYHKGEIPVEGLMRLVASAAGVVGGVGWMATAAIAYNVPMLLVYGGQGALDGPERLWGPYLPTPSVQHVLPDSFCMCSMQDHSCDKRITKFGDHVERFLAQVVKHSATNPSA